MAPRFLTILTDRNLPKIWQDARSGCEPEPSIINEKTIADFARVVEQTGILRREIKMDGFIYDSSGKQIGFVKDGFAHDRTGQPIFKLDGANLLDLISGEVVCHLTPAGLANTPGHELEGNASHHFTKNR